MPTATATESNIAAHAYMPTSADESAIRAYLEERYVFPSPEALTRLVALGLDARACSAADLREFYQRAARHLPPSYFRDRQ